MSDAQEAEPVSGDVTMDVDALSSVTEAVSVTGDADMARDFADQVRANIDKLTIEQHYMIANSLATMSAAAFGAEREQKSLTLTVDPMTFVLVLQAASVLLNESCLSKWGSGEQPKPE